MNKPMLPINATISAEALQRHRVALAFNNPPSRASMFADLISQIIDKLQISEVLDYGCGNGDLVASLRPDRDVTIQRYDPAHENYSGRPLPMQMVVAIDVLQYVEPEYLDAVLVELRELTNVVLFVVIGAQERGPTCQQWCEKLWQHFELHTLQRLDVDDCYMILYSTKPVIEEPHRGN